ncbi:putative protein phosphatase 2C 33 [Zea mays]|jgi:hypothetical protein|uniref:protein-serine/threonine phosphatase n=1 Tax=Zea mays TaxID=4577 RepID=A0A1D6H2Y9_MAIZE|nr:putative protein phosphatase 2C 33 [Zea mays]
MEDDVFCGVFDGHDRCGQLVSKLARDHLPFMILSQRNVLLLGSDDDDDGDGDDTAFSDASPAASSSTDGSRSGRPSPSLAPAPAQMLEVWREAYANAFETTDRELGVQSRVDWDFSGTMVVCAIKQGRTSSSPSSVTPGPCWRPCRRWAT